ncbi:MULTISPECIES: hypothetical protein [unclassified Rhizobium]|uniref:hypothetical protein n=1 Tax=unclassified Rhizobium TaxID=2613769 RepID=UPI001ADC5DAC|nr:MULTISPECIES: hypothetical protein [unclassified Rhizobium]MBO9100300.1 hypothetical protein [Rhizobium sp. L58/93]MBO9135542.1 hypothetical protein [Rhizobium sp. B209b/85]MBO9170266.1 hypothetical protein [Rhizobium sp. L245/93]MBO9186193.1 hypothetical protein [Rhizobium sp. E27B/91]QXZ83115.1 hypothetical protein J5287_13665 [Rhizobium sp. K1/93]
MAMIHWAFELPNGQTETACGSKQQFSSWLKQKALCRRSPTEWIVDVIGTDVTERFTYTHMPAGEPLWTLTWGEPLPVV